MHPPADRTVLVLEDDDDLGLAVCEALEDQGYGCWLARAAAEALAIMARERRSPDVILLDLRLPGTSSGTFLAEVKARPEWADIPVILTTGVNTQEIPVLPVEAVLLKPYDLEALLDVVGRALAESRGAGAQYGESRRAGV